MPKSLRFGLKHEHIFAGCINIYCKTINSISNSKCVSTSAEPNDNLVMPPMINLPSYKYLTILTTERNDFKLKLKEKEENLFLIRQKQQHRRSYFDGLHYYISYG